AFRCLIAADRRNPGVVIRQRRTQWLDLSEIAAPVRIAAPELRSFAAGLLLHCEFRLHSADRDAVAILDLTPQLVRLGKKQTGIERKDVDRQRLTANEIGDDAVFDAEAGGERQPRRESV